MPETNEEVVSDKLTSIKNYVKNLLWLRGIIDEDGNILDLEKYRAEIETTHKNRLIELEKNTTSAGVVIDPEIASELFGEIAYLENIKKHRHNLNPLKEYPIVDMAEKKSALPSKRRLSRAYHLVRILLMNPKKHTK